VALLKAGSKWVKRPDCSVEVVDAITMVWACAAQADAIKAKDTKKRREK
jgi:hypothetical protein